MVSYTHSHFEPTAPSRSSTGDSHQSMSSGAATPGSDSLSPTSTFSRRGQSAKSPIEESFLGAIASRMRGRSRSRSRNGKSRDRSRSPMLLPPEQFPSTPTPRRTHATQTPQQPRHASHASQSSVSSTATKATRPSLQGPTRRSTSGSDMWRGRHSNTWLFNDFSVTDTAKDIFHFGRKS
ncbi:hypothetical protein K491DRAFT_589380 [Lophiostoma macrostomum CBS 122681]|uniref:Uncharacterized protein n=1 Tax=Lophiostoma macrostomum CBS 122681 TaxID=1314788 RepID=A0A6A6TKP1_9PLEO|nr:hypothetical protein K491DRAFT_589380 [Lophiostoma macrostomum CBS 122681]